jgi:hypothetical protein
LNSDLSDLKANHSRIEKLINAEPNRRTKDVAIALSVTPNVTCPPKVVPDCKLGYGKTIKEAGYVKEAL